MSNTYDSRIDTLLHIQTVRRFLARAANSLSARSAEHDHSKLVGIEREGYDRMGASLRDTTYGSDEYFAAFEREKAAILHHYQNGSHHPEHYAMEVDGTLDDVTVRHGNAIAQMTLLDLVEMLADWKAASLRHADGSFDDSLPFNKKRFGIGDQLFHVLENTATELQLWDGDHDSQLSVNKEQ